jgi:MFS family permease
VLLTGLGLLPSVIGVLLALVGLLILAAPLRSLMPAGTFTARTGLPSAIAARGLFIACYYGTESFLVLALTTIKGYSADEAGLIVALASLSWSIAAWMGSRFDNRDGGWGRRRRVVIGVALMLIGTTAVIPVIWLPSGALLLAAIGQIVAGFGNGLAHPTSGAIALGYAERGKEGEVSATLQFADAFTPAVSIGIGGAIVALGYAVGWLSTIGIAAALGLQLLQISLGFYAAYRLPRGENAILQSKHEIG